MDVFNAHPINKLLLIIRSAYVTLIQVVIVKEQALGYYFPPNIMIQL